MQGRTTLPRNGLLTGGRAIGRPWDTAAGRSTILYRYRKAGPCWNRGTGRYASEGTVAGPRIFCPDEASLATGNAARIAFRTTNDNWSDH